MRKLGIRTYKIIPMTPQTGIIEWVNNTIPFGSYLCDSKETNGPLGAHSRYYPNDITNQKARSFLESSKEKDSMRETILKLTEQVAQLAIKVEFLQKENNELHQALSKK